jgi:predicted metal-binding membrane protein
MPPRGCWPIPLFQYGTLLFARWTVMMARVMLPFAALTLLLFTMLMRSHDAAHAPRRACLADYLLV